VLVSSRAQSSADVFRLLNGFWHAGRASGQRAMDRCSFPGRDLKRGSPFTSCGLPARSGPDPFDDVKEH
jgi:hypothetical protein